MIRTCHSFADAIVGEISEARYPGADGYGETFRRHLSQFFDDRRIADPPMLMAACHAEAAALRLVPEWAVWDPAINAMTMDGARFAVRHRGICAIAKADFEQPIEAARQATRLIFEKYGPGRVWMPKGTMSYWHQPKVSGMSHVPWLGVFEDDGVEAVHVLLGARYVHEKMLTEPRTEPVVLGSFAEALAETPT